MQATQKGRLTVIVRPQSAGSRELTERKDREERLPKKEKTTGKKGESEGEAHVACRQSQLPIE
jgi:hypothetical protein